MKKILILIPILSAFLFFGFSKEVKALDPNDFDGYFESHDVTGLYASNRPVNMSSNYLETYIPIDVSSYRSYDFTIFDLSTLLPIQNLLIDSIMEGSVKRGTHLRLLDENGSELTKIFDIFYPNYIALYSIPESVYKIEIVAVYSVDDPSMTELQRMQQQSTVSNHLNQRALSGTIFVRFYNEGAIMSAEQFFDYLDTYINEYKANQQTIYDQIYNNARNDFGKYHNGVWLTADQWGDIEYNRGQQSSQGDAYDAGYIKGSNESFMATIKDWIVPAIIVVIILGGFVTIIQKRKNGDT